MQKTKPRTKQNNTSAFFRTRNSNALIIYPHPSRVNPRSLSAVVENNYALIFYPHLSRVNPRSLFVVVVVVAAAVVVVVLLLVVLVFVLVFVLISVKSPKRVGDTDTNTANIIPHKSRVLCRRRRRCSSKKKVHTLDS